jgi:hypothetical protein
MADENAMSVQQRNAMAAMEDPANRQTLTQRYAPNLREYMPEWLANYLAEAMKYPMVPGFRGPMGGGLSPQDFAIAEQLRNKGMNGAAGRPWETADTMGQFTGVRNWSRVPEPDPYRAAVLEQRFGRKAGNVNQPPEPGSVEAWRMARQRDGAFRWPETD